MDARVVKLAATASSWPRGICEVLSAPRVRTRWAIGRGNVWYEHSRVEYRLDLLVNLRTHDDALFANVTAHRYPTDRFWDSDRHLVGRQVLSACRSKFLIHLSVDMWICEHAPPDSARAGVDAFAEAMRRVQIHGMVPCWYDPQDPEATVSLSDAAVPADSVADARAFNGHDFVRGLAMVLVGFAVCAVAGAVVIVAMQVRPDLRSDYEVWLRSRPDYGAGGETLH